MKKMLNKANQPPAQSPHQHQSQQELHSHAKERMALYIKQAEEKIEKKIKENEMLKAKAVELIKVGKKEDARKLVARKKRNEEFLNTLNKRIMTVDKYMGRLDEVQDHKDFMDILAQTNTVVGKNRDQMEQIQEVLQDAQATKNEAELARQELNDMLDVDDVMEDDEIEDMLKEYEDQVNEDLKQNLKKHDDKIFGLKPKQPVAQKEAKKKEDVDDLIQELMKN